ncbi:MAG TPA: restriction endonuclease [Thermomicrobiales bacterium]|nr:restriction endonuclease [Thermomicrobiales bacterium]
MAVGGHAVSAAGSGALRCRLTDAMREFVAALDAPQLLAVAETLLISAGYHLIDGERANPNDGPTSCASRVLGLDALGLARVLVQAVQSEAPIQSGAIHRFAREMSTRRCRFGVMLAQHEFVPDAREALTLIERDVMLIDGQELARRLADRALGASQQARGRVLDA